MAKYDKKEKIITAAIELVAEKGYFNTTVSQIAKKANIAVGSVYLYFDNKDSILHHIFSSFVENLKNNIIEKQKSASTVYEKLQLLISSIFITFNDSPLVAKIILQELRQTNKSFYEISRKTLNSIIIFFERILQEGIETDEIRKINTQETSIALLGIIEMVGFFWVLENFPYDLNSRSEDIFNLIFKGIRKE